jgi:phospholipid transport system substrate-binding protein
MKTANRSMKAIVLALLLPAALTPAATPASSPASTARAVVESALQDVLKALRDKNLSPAEKRDQVRQIAYAGMDFETMSRLSLGRNWRDIPEAKRDEFIKEFRDHMSATYGRALDRYSDEDLKVTGERADSNTDRTVQTIIVKPGAGAGESIPVDYRLRQKDKVWKVIDVTVDGVSIVTNFRAQFQDVLAKGGIDRLLTLLREKNAAAAKESPDAK